MSRRRPYTLLSRYEKRIRRAEWIHAFGQFLACVSLIALGCAWIVALQYLFPPMMSSPVTGDNWFFVLVLFSPTLILFGIAMTILADRNW